VCVEFLLAKQTQDNHSFIVIAGENSSLNRKQPGAVLELTVVPRGFQV
jgi:hypothetical protein